MSKTIWKQRAKAFIWLSDRYADYLHEEQVKNAKLLKEKSECWCDMVKANQVLARINDIINSVVGADILVERIRVELDKL